GVRFSHWGGLKRFDTEAAQIGRVAHEFDLSFLGRDGRLCHVGAARRSQRSDDEDHNGRCVSAEGHHEREWSSLDLSRHSSRPVPTRRESRTDAGKRRIQRLSAHYPTEIWVAHWAGG